MIDNKGLPSQAPIAYIMSRFPQITETFILREMLELERQGQPVVILPLLRVRQTVRHCEIEQLLECVHYTPFLSLPILAANFRCLLRRPLRYLRLLTSVLIGNIGSANLFFGALGIFPKSVYFAKLISELGVCHVHAHFATHPALSALVISELTEVSFSITVHAHDIFVRKTMLGEKLRKARFVASISEFNKKYLLKLFPDINENKIRVVRCGIKPEAYDGEKPTAAARENAAGFDILCVASLQPYKGIEYLIRACSLLREHISHLRCVVIGEGFERAKLETLIKKLGLSRTVRLVGARPQNEVTEQLRTADLFVLPSVIAPDGQMEGIPVALMEAMASRLPVISTTLSGIPELVSDGDSGLLVPPGDEKALADAILSLYRKPLLRQQMGEAGRQCVEREYDLQRNVAKLKSFFDESNEEKRLEPDSSPAKKDFSQSLVFQDVSGKLRALFSETGETDIVVHDLPLNGGYDSVVYALTLAGASGVKRDIVLKLHRRTHEKSDTVFASEVAHAQNEYRALSRLWKDFGASGGRFRVPEPLALLPEQCAVVTEKCDGERLDRMLRYQGLGRGAVPCSRIISAIEAVGEWLAKFHAVTRRGLDKGQAIARLGKEFAADLDSCRAFGFDSGLLDRVKRYFEANIESIAAEGGFVVSQHCDFGPHNMFVSGDVITVIDFEGMQDGLIYDDLAYFLCVIDVIPFYHLTHSMKREARAAFLNGYGDKTLVNADLLRFYQLPVIIKIAAHNPAFRRSGSKLNRLRRLLRRQVYTQRLEEIVS